MLEKSLLFCICDHWSKFKTFFSKIISSQSKINPLQPSIAFHIETGHLTCRAKQVTGFYMQHWAEMS